MEYYDKCERCRKDQTDNEYCHFCSKHLYHNRNEHSIHIGVGRDVSSATADETTLIPGLISDYISYDLTRSSPANDIRQHSKTSVQLEPNNDNMKCYTGLSAPSTTIRRKVEAKISSVQLKYEDELRSKMHQLYSKSSTIDEFRLNDGFINGGRGFTLVPFYYSDNNIVAQDLSGDNRRCIMSFAKEWEHNLEGDDPYCYYRYDLLAAVSMSRLTREVNDEENCHGDATLQASKMCYRSYVSMCRLNSNTEYGNEFILVALLITLCKDKRIDSMVYSTKLRQIFIWQDTQMLEQFYCDPKLEFDVKTVREEWKKYLDRYSWVYKRSKLLPRDIHDPAKRGKNQKLSYEVVVAKEVMWKKVIGLKSRSDSILSSTRKTRGYAKVITNDLSDVDDSDNNAAELKRELLQIEKEKEKAVAAHDKVSTAHEKLKNAKKAVESHRDDLQQKTKDLTKALREANAKIKYNNKQLENNEGSEIIPQKSKRSKQTVINVPHTAVSGPNESNTQQPALVQSQRNVDKHLDTSIVVSKALDRIMEQAGSLSAKEEKFFEMFGQKDKAIQESHYNAIAAILES